MKNNDTEWKGYTMQELMMHRAINSIRLEVEKEKVLARYEKMRAGFSGTVTSFLFRNLGTLSRSLGLATTAFTVIRKIYSVFR